MDKIAIVIRGPAAVGKSSVSIELKKFLSEYALLSIDVFRHMIAEDSSDMRRKIARDMGVYFLQQVVQYGLSVIIEEVFHDEYLAELKKILNEHKYKIITIFLYAPERELQKRNASRGKVKSAETIGKFSALSAPDKDDFVIDTSVNSLHDVVCLILDKAKMPS